MDKNISVLIVENNILYINDLKDYIDSQNDMRVVGVARDGQVAFGMIEELSPTFVILDIIIPGMDGICILESVLKSEKDKPPFIIVTSSINNDIYINKTIELGADYYVIKPFEIEILVRRMRQILEENDRITNYKYINKRELKEYDFTENNRKRLEILATALMQDMGISSHYAGFKYLRETIIRATYGTYKYKSIAKALYPSVAKKFNTSPQKVESAIRYAISNVWQCNEVDSSNKAFGYTNIFNKAKFTNTEIIALMADKMRLSLENKTLK